MATTGKEADERPVRQCIGAESANYRGSSEEWKTKKESSLGGSKSALGHRRAEDREPSSRTRQPEEGSHGLVGGTASAPCWAEAKWPLGGCRRQDAISQRPWTRTRQRREQRKAKLRCLQHASLILQRIAGLVTEECREGSSSASVKGTQSAESAKRQEAAD